MHTRLPPNPPKLQWALPFLSHQMLKSFSIEVKIMKYHFGAKIWHFVCTIAINLIKTCVLIKDRYHFEGNLQIERSSHGYLLYALMISTVIDSSRQFELPLSKPISCWELPAFCISNSSESLRGPWEFMSTTFAQKMLHPYDQL